jgi:uncharacterized protein YcaQ
MLRALGLVTPHRDVGEAIAHHGFIQLDPINVCGRMHDLILRNRVAGYREGDLLAHLHGTAPDRLLAPQERVAFEHYFDVLTVLPLDAWPYLVPRMRARARQTNVWGGKLNRDESRLAQRILAVIAEHGAVTSDDIEHDVRALTAWNTRARQVKVVLEKLFFHGRVLIASRRNFRRVYALPEHVLPSGVLNQPEPSPKDVERWQVRMKLLQRRLVKLSRPEAARVADLVQPVQVGAGAPLYCLCHDAPLFDDVAGDEHIDALPPRLLAPLDPLIYDRVVTRRVWDFNYTWEVYTPAHKRVRGYYALPVLAGSQIVGHVDPKADREKRRLTLVSRRVRRGFSTAAATRELARFLGLTRVARRQG